MKFKRILSLFVCLFICLFAFTPSLFATRQFSRDFLLEVSKGNVPGHSLVFKFGKNDDLDTAGFETIWNGGGLYTGFDQVSGDSITVNSGDVDDVGTLVNSGTATGGTATTLTSTGISGIVAGDVLINDTKADHGIVVSATSTVITVWRFINGTIPESGDTYRVANASSTGAPVLHLPFIRDTNYDRQVEYIILNGQSDVATVGTNYIRSSRGRIHGGTNEGQITAFPTSTPANIYMVMPVGTNSTMIAADTIPRGFSGFIVQWFSSISAGAGVTGDITFQFKARQVGDSFQLLAEMGALLGGSSFIEESFQAPVGPIPEMSDFRIDGIASQNNMVGTARWTLLLIENQFLGP